MPIKPKGNTDVRYGLRSRALTLIELLVVAAIIGIIAAILFPIFTSAKRRANDASVTTHMKQLAMAIRLYMEDGQLYRPPLNITSLWADHNLQPLGRTPGVPWAPEYVDDRPRAECPLFGDLVYSRYVHPFWKDEDWDFWLGAYNNNPPILASLHVVANELEDMPSDDDHACGNDIPWMVSRSLQVRLDGSMKLEREPEQGRGTMFSFADLFNWAR